MKKLLLPLLLLAANLVGATVLYVNPNHPNANDTNWGDTPDTPWATLNVANWAENDTIMVSNAVYTISQKGFITKKVTVIGESKADVIFQGEDDMSFNFNMTTCRFFMVSENTEVTFKNITIKNLLYDWHNGEQDATSTYGGVFDLSVNAILNLKNVDIKKAKIYGNGGNAWGAAIMNRGTVNADSCLFESCYATQGGAMYMLGGSVSNLTNCKFIGNGNPEVVDYDTYRFGGAINIAGGTTITVDKCYFENNFTDKNGTGGVFMIRYDADKICNLNVTNSTFNANKSGYAGSVLYCGANTAPTALTELNIGFTNCVFYKNVGCRTTPQYNNTISLPLKANYPGKGRFVFVNNSMFGNYNPGQANTRSISFGDVNMEYYFINNLMNDNEADDQTAQTGVYGIVLEGSYNVAPVNVKTLVVQGNVFNMTGGAFSSINFPNLSSVDHPEMKNQTGQRLARTQLQTGLKLSDKGIHYLDFTSSTDSVSVALNNGVNEYMLDGVNLVPQTDILGNAISDQIRDAGAWEMQSTNTGIYQITGNNALLYPNPFNTVLNFSVNADKVEIFNIHGQKVYQKDYPEMSVSTSDLPMGLYLIKLIQNGNTFIAKALKN